MSDQGTSGQWPSRQDEGTDASGTMVPANGYGFASASMQPTAPQPFVLTIGDIGVTGSVIVTPNGNAPLRGSQWIVTDQSVTQQKIPTWAIVCAIIFALFCLLGLFFLLAKEEVTTGYANVQVHSGDLLHSVQIPVSSPQQVMNLRALVAQAQTLAARAA